MNPVIDNTTTQRYELQASGRLAFIDYRRNNGIVTLTHTYVPPELNGRGIGSALTRGALELISAQGEQIIPLCSFIVAFIERYPEYRKLLATPT